jgi:hypothetical protein
MRHFIRSLGVAVMVVALLAAVMAPLVAVDDWSTGLYVRHVPFWVRLPVGLALGTAFLWMFLVTPVRRLIARR